MNSIIKYVATEYGPKYLGAKVELQDVDVNLFTGTYTIEGLKVYNPEGCKTEYAFYCKTMIIEMPLKSMWSDDLVIDKIFMDGTIVIYEGVKGGKSNFDIICENLDKALGYDPNIPPLDDDDGTYLIGSTELVKTKVKWSPRILGKGSIGLPVIPKIAIGEIKSEEDEKGRGKSMSKLVKQINKEIRKDVKRNQKYNKKLQKEIEKERKRRERS